MSPWIAGLPIWWLAMMGKPASMAAERWRRSGPHRDWSCTAVVPLQQTATTPDPYPESLKIDLLTVLSTRMVGVYGKEGGLATSARAVMVAAMLSLVACSGGVPDSGSAGTIPEPAGATAAAGDRPREGPWRVLCFQDEELVFEHNQIYRVWHPEARPPHWAYETPDGLRFRGRMGTDLNCVWRRPQGQRPPPPG